MKKDIFFQKATISNETINHWGEEIVVDDIFNRYVDSIKSDIKKLAKTTMLYDIATQSTAVEIEIAILSTQEYRRLKDIEKQYKQIEAPLYRALVKGHELIDSAKSYWYFNKAVEGVFISNSYNKYHTLLWEMTKEEWNKLGINDTNADFIEIGKV